MLERQGAGCQQNEAAELNHREEKTRVRRSRPVPRAGGMKRLINAESVAGRQRARRQRGRFCLASR